MKLKKLLALLLALVMVFSLAACASKDKDDADEKEDEKTEQTDKKDDAEEDKDEDKQEAPAKADYHTLVDAMLAFADDPTSKTLGYAAGGTVGGEEMEAFLDFFLEMAGTTVADLVPALEVGDFEDSGAEPLDEAALKDAQEQLDGMVADWTDMRDSLKEESAAAADADWEEIAASLEMSVDEAKAFIDKMVGVLDDLINAFDGQTITEGCTVKGATNDVAMYFCGDKWFSELLFNFN